MPHTPRETILEKLKLAQKKVKVGEKYMHTKSGGRYVVTNIVAREDNEEVRVIYKELDHKPAISWDRSFDGKDGWIVPTEINGKLTPRFKKTK